MKSIRDFVIVFDNIDINQKLFKISLNREWNAQCACNFAFKMCFKILPYFSHVQYTYELSWKKTFWQMYLHKLYQHEYYSLKLCDIIPEF